MRIMIIILLALAVAPADANPKATPAQQLNTEGIKAARAKDWETARQKFEQSYAIDPEPLTLFNLASAQEKTDKFVAARASYNLYLTKSKPGDDDTFRKTATAKLAELDGKIATLKIATTYDADVAIDLDGRELDAMERATPILVDPGEHALTARKGTQVLQKKSVMLSPGSRADITLSPPLPDPNTVKAPDHHDVVVVAPPPPPPKPPAEHGSSVFASPWFWGITAVVVAGATVGGYYEFTTHDPIRGTLGPGVVTAP